MRMRLVVLLCLLLSLVVGRVEAAESRFALVIGNAKYPDGEAPLKEPINDMKAMADELKRSGFDVATGENLSSDAMKRSFNALYDKIKPGTVAMIFYSGYGIQSGRESFMIPTDAQIWEEKDVRRDGISLDSVLREMNSRGAVVKIAILDASRRNPYERRFRQLSMGLAPVTAPRGSLVMYSAPPNNLVGDSTTDRSLFVTELLKEIRVPNITADEAFNRTSRGVSRVSKSEQIPWFSSSLDVEFSFLKPLNLPTPTDQENNVRPPVTPPPITPPPVTPPPVTPPPVTPPPPVVQTPPPPPEDPRLAAINADPAMQELTRLILTNPNDQAAFYKRGQLYAVKGAYPQAMKDFDDAIRLLPSDVEALNNRCWVRMIAGELTGALRDCNAALQLRPNFADALDSRGLVHLKNGQPASAIPDFDAALRLNAKLASSLYGRGLARQRTGNAAAGDRDLAAAKAIDPNVANEFTNTFGIR